MQQGLLEESCFLVQIVIKNHKKSITVIRLHYVSVSEVIVQLSLIQPNVQLKQQKILNDIFKKKIAKRLEQCVYGSSEIEHTLKFNTNNFHRKKFVVTEEHKEQLQDVQLISNDSSVLIGQHLDALVKYFE